MIPLPLGGEMGRFDQDTSVMRERLAATPINLLKPELPPHGKVRGISNGVLLGAILWAGLIALGVVLWRRFSG